MRKILLAMGLSLCVSFASHAQWVQNDDKDSAGKFRQLGELLPTPNTYRNASGAPGAEYWQQQVDYVINSKLDEDTQSISASMDISYTNNSPDTLTFLWLALDQNRFKDGSLARTSETASGSKDSLSFSSLTRMQGYQDRDYGFYFEKVETAEGEELTYVVNDSMMRIDLTTPLNSGENTMFSIAWNHSILDEEVIGGRGGFEHFEEQDNYIFALSQWFPRLAAYTDYAGWQNKQFLGRGEFTLEFGDYHVNLTVPSNHIVSASGELQNPGQVLSPAQRNRLRKSNEDGITFIVTPEEAKENESTKASGTKTWRYKADNVRDFAWSSSPKYIWDAMTFKQDDEVNPEVLAMSFYPNEAEPIWSKFSTHSVVHTMDVYNRFAFNYPYPTAQSVNAWDSGGMEYPMITFNGYRPTDEEVFDDRTYTRHTKYGLVGVIIHEIGHIYFPMTVNSDEREWTWMDEGINTFLEYMAEYEWEENYPIRGNMQNPLDEITSYMTSTNQVPIMTQSDSILQFGSNAYAKPAAALIVLRETVMGRELFDFAFREYSQRWKFKRPTPADFFRTMEDASAVDLDWFWRGWFFGVDHVDMAINDVREYQVSTKDPDIESDFKRAENLSKRPENIVQRRNREEGRSLRIDRFEDLKDLYNETDKFSVSNKDRNKYKAFLDKLSDRERAVFDRAQSDGQYLYFIDFENKGGLVSPLPLQLTYDDGRVEEMMLPAELWRRNSTEVTKLIVTKSALSRIDLDIAHQTADADYSNNGYPQVIAKSRLDLSKSDFSRKNLMADMKIDLKTETSDENDVPLETIENSDGAEKPKESAPVTTDNKPNEKVENKTEQGVVAKTLKRLKTAFE